MDKSTTINALKLPETQYMKKLRNLHCGRFAVIVNVFFCF